MLNFVEKGAGMVGGKKVESFHAFDPDLCLLNIVYAICLSNSLMKVLILGSFDLFFYWRDLKVIDIWGVGRD